jgi:phage gp36-like protein
MVYATSSDLIIRYDKQTIADLLSDTGTPVADGNLATDSKLLAILTAASGRVDAAVMVSDNYTSEELAALTGNSLALLKDIVCDLAMVRLLRRRPEKFGDEGTVAAFKEAEEYLDRLRRGERLFDVTSHKEAGLPTVDGPTANDYANLNLIPDRTKHFYPRRTGRLPIGR